MLPPISPGDSADSPTVRSATPADRTALAAIHHRAWHASYAAAAPPSVVAAMTTAAVTTLWDSWTGTEADGYTTVAVAENLVVGFLTVRVPTANDATPSAAPTETEVLGIYIDPLHTRHGHASRLLNDAAERAQAVACQMLTVWVPSVDAPRLTLYRSAGLRPTGGKRILSAPDPTEPDLTELHLAASLAPSAVTEPKEQPQPGPGTP